MFVEWWIVVFVDICSSILTAMSAVVLLQYTLTCYASVGGATRHTVVRQFVIHSFCPQAELSVGGKLSADTCNTCSTRCCLGIELIDFWFQSFVTLNGIAGLAQHCGTSLKIKLSTIVFFTACTTILYSR